MAKCPRCNVEINAERFALLNPKVLYVCPKCIDIYHHEHRKCIKHPEEQLDSFFSWDRLEANIALKAMRQSSPFLEEKRPASGSSEAVKAFPCGLCDDPITQDDFISGGKKGAMVCPRCHVAYHAFHKEPTKTSKIEEDDSDWTSRVSSSGKPLKMCPLHLDKNDKLFVSLDAHFPGWESFRNTSGALTTRELVKAAKELSENQLAAKRERREKARKGEYDEDISKGNARAKQADLDEVPSSRTASGRTIWVIGHGATLEDTTTVPEGMTVTFYTEPDRTSDQSANTFIIETLGGSRSGRRVQGKVTDQMQFSPNYDDELRRGRSDMIALTDNAYRIGGDGPFANTTKLCGSQSPSTCGHEDCGGVLSAAMNLDSYADLRILACRPSVARARAELSKSQVPDEVLRESVKNARKQREQERRSTARPKETTPLGDHLEEKKISGYLETKSLKYMHPSTVEFQTDLTLDREDQLARAKRSPELFAMDYRDMNRRSRADLAISDSDGVLQHPSIKIAGLEGTLAEVAEEVRRVLESSTTPCESLSKESKIRSLPSPSSSKSKQCTMRSTNR